MRSLIHIGCGSDRLPDWLGAVQETRLDIDERYSPDIVADMRHLPEALKYDLLYCSHALEHLSPHDVIPALKGFRGTLNDDGGVIVFVPDLEGVQATEEVLFTSPAGPITGMDLLYGYRPALKDSPHMAHKTGFTQASLHAAMVAAGFAEPVVIRLSDYALMGAAKK